MTRRNVWLGVCLALGCLLALPTAARAQSSIAGTVKDTSGAVLPGVTVEVSSPALIEKTKAATTDGGGAYRIIGLRPGMYTVKFTLTGFATVERAAFQLLSDFNARIDAELKVGALAETIIVTGAAPIVDVTTAAHVVVVDRDAIDNVPTSKTIQGLGQLILGVSLNAPDVGGSTGAMQTYMSLRGASVAASNNTAMVDGLMVNSLQTDGTSLPYSNDANIQEVTYQTAAIGAERSGGGVVLNMVPKEGGNRFSGSASGIYRPGQLQGNNYSDRFKLWGLPLDKHGDPAVSRIKRVSDLNVAEGGPILKDKLWFFASARDFQPINTVANTFLNDGSQGLDDNYIRQALVRLTYQVSPRHKLAAFYERTFKWRGHDMTAFSDPETVAIVWTSPNYSTGTVKYTGTLSSRLLVEAGFAQTITFFRQLDQPGVEQQRSLGSDASCLNQSAWCANASHTAPGGFRGVSPNSLTTEYPLSQVYQGSVSYVTAHHHAKAGVSLRTGFSHHFGDTNADLTQNYPTAFRDANDNYNIHFPTSALSAADFSAFFPALTQRPCTPTVGSTTCTVTISTTPRVYGESLNNDMGIFLQDSFTMKRLTINGGIRYETLRSQIDALTSPEGRFVPARTTDVRENLPNWKDGAPRFQVVYDVFGNSKTAVKYSFNRYNEAVATSVANSLNPVLVGAVASLISGTPRNWTDLNGDDIAQGQRTWSADGKTYTDCVYLTPGCEINLSGTATQPALAGDFGLLSQGGVYTQFPRRYRLEQGLEIQHALLPRLSITGTYYHGNNKNLTKTVNRAITDDGSLGTQFRPVTLFNPIDGTPYLYYNTIATIPTDNLTYLEPLRKITYDTYLADMRMRPYAGAQLSGGIEFTRVLNKDCGTSAFKADGVTPALVNPNDLRFCDDWNLRAFDGGPRIGKPFTKNFKLSGAFPIIYGINLGVSYQNLDSGGLSPTFRYGTGFTYPDGSIKYPMLGGSTPFPACPITYGCVPGAVTVPANWVGSAAGTIVNKLVPTGTIAEERIVELDLKASKNFRIGRIRLQPAVEAFNLLNVDQVRGRVVDTGAGSGLIGVSTGTYLQPNNTLQGRIIGFGVNAKW